MTETLAQLLLRLSEAGEPVILWGRAAKPYLGVAFDEVLNSGVLIEEAPAREWPVCATCECNFDARPIRTIKGRHIACCPIDQNSDEVLDDADLRTFRVDMRLMVERIAAASGIAGQPSELVPGVWRLGAAKAGTIFFVPNRTVARQLGMIALIKGCASNPVLVAPPLDADATLQLTQVGIPRLKVATASGGSFALKLDAVEDQAGEPRIVLHEARKVALIDGHEIHLTQRLFKLLRVLMQGVIVGEPIVSTRTLDATLWPTSVVSTQAAADAIRDLRALLRKVVGDEALIHSRPGLGYELTLPASALRIEETVSRIRSP